MQQNKPLNEIDLINNTDPVCVEVCVKTEYADDLRLLKMEVYDFLQSEPVFQDNIAALSEYPRLENTLEFIRISSSNFHSRLPKNYIVRYYSTPSTDYVEDLTLSEDPSLSAATITNLPCSRFQNTWESLYFEDYVKESLLSYTHAALRLSAINVHPSIVSVNRSILLHGPSGTGKTTFSQGLAQKIAIQMQPTYTATFLVEIHAHSLFSKSITDLGKVISSLFQQIKKLASEKYLVFVLLDEVESLAVSRKTMLNSADSADTIRAVNSLLSQLDSLNRFTNIFLLSTSNISESLDLAFIDRCDLKILFSNPGYSARYSILNSCFEEMFTKGIFINDVEIGLFEELVNSTENWSGRMLRRLPFLTFVKKFAYYEGNISLSEFIRESLVVVKEEEINHYHSFPPQ